MRPLALTLTRLTALGLAATACWYTARFAADELEARTGETVVTMLASADLDWVWVEADGMLVVLRGAAPDEAARFRALATAGEVINPLNLRDRMTMATPVTQTIPDYRVEMMRNGKDVLIHGLAPAPDDNAEGARTAAEAGLAALDGLFVQNLVAELNEPEPQGWIETIALGAGALAELEMARVIVTGDALTVEGIAPSHDAAQALRNRLSRDAPESFDLTVNLRQPRPVLQPFTARFTIDEAGARFDTCAAESREGRAQILAAAQAAGAAEGAECTLALGAADPAWGRSVATGIETLGQIGRGTITFSDLTVTLVLGADVDPSVAAPRIDALETALPDLYRLVVLNAPAGPSEGGVAARFTATRSPEGLVNIRGPVGNLRAQTIVETFAAAQFGQGALHTALRNEPDLPDLWPVHVMAGLDALDKLETGMVTITPSFVEVRGATGDPKTEADIARGLAKALGPEAVFELDVRYEEKLDPVPETPSPFDCVDRVNAILADRKITFAPGSVDLDSDGLETVGLIAEALFNCPDARMEIGGHTDSQGREEMNQLLSQARADSVLNALMARRVLVSNLTSKGYGEAEPIADNETEEGREANRRIQFTLVDASGAPVVPEPGPVDNDAVEDAAIANQTPPENEAEDG